MMTLIHNLSSTIPNVHDAPLLAHWRGVNFYFFCYFFAFHFTSWMNSKKPQVTRDKREFLYRQKAVWRVTYELIEMVQYLLSLSLL
jgi:hypothetical protein